MTITMNTQLMSALVDLLHKMRILLNLFSYQKECCADIMYRQYIQNLGRIFGVWTIVKGKSDRAVGCIPAPEHAWMADLHP